MSARRLYLPGGGSFDLVLPAPGERVRLRSHEVDSLADRVDVLRGLVWGPKTARLGNAAPQTLQGTLRDPLMRRIGLLVTRHCMARNDHCELAAVFDFVTKNVRYTGDIAHKDTFQSALRTLQFGGGDCDDHSVLAAVIAMENGFQTKWRITSNTGRTWDHIYALAGVPKHAPRRWVALDTTLGTGRFGREPPHAKKTDFDVTTRAEER
jgi:hypothetical protein